MSTIAFELHMDIDRPSSRLTYCQLDLEVGPSSQLRTYAHSPLPRRSPYAV